MQVIHEKLTKRFFMTIPEGSYLVSNVLLDRWEPVFQEFVSPKSIRQMQWSRIKHLRVDQRTCRVFQEKEHFIKWVSEVS